MRDERPVIGFLPVMFLVWAAVFAVTLSLCGCATVTRLDDSASSGDDTYTKTWIWPACEPKDPPPSAPNGDATSRGLPSVPVAPGSEGGSP